jgi:hypothetical protein
MRATNNAPGDSGQAAAARPTVKSRAAKQLEILALRTLELADRVACGELKFIDAVDVSYEAAIGSGLAPSLVTTLSNSRWRPRSPMRGGREPTAIGKQTRKRNLQP